MKTREFIAAHFRHTRGFSITEAWKIVKDMEAGEPEDVYRDLQEPHANHQTPTIAALILTAERYAPKGGTDG